MHFHADHTLFFEHRKPLWHTIASLVLTVCILTINTSTSLTFSLIGSGIGSLLLFISYIRGHKRIEPIFAWTLGLIAMTLIGGAFLRLDINSFLETVARISCGIIWILWLGSQVDWVSLRQILLLLRVPKSIVSSLDNALMHGILTQKEWSRRRDAAQLRLGISRLPLNAWGSIIGEGAFHGFIRLEHVENNAILRSSPTPVTIKSQMTHLGNTINFATVDVKRGKNIVLKQIDLHFTSGEWVLLCGPSGAGKSSVLRLIAGLDKPSNGTMTRFGSSISSKTELRERLDGRVALLIQNPEHHFIASTVAEDIMWGLRKRGITEKEALQKCTDITKSLGVDHLLERPCHQLSFGEQRRVALAGILVLNPSILLLDEPTSGLDPVSAYELRLLIEKIIQKTGATCIWATHDLKSVPPQARRVVLLRQGNVIFDGETSEGLSRPWLLKAGLAIPQKGEMSC